MDQALWNDLGLSAAGLEKLQQFAALVEKWTQRINLIARSTVPDLWARHIEDSARLVPFAPAAPRLWADFGAGGGFPGLVVAVILQDRGAATRMVLVESDQRKATFLREASRQLDLGADVRAERADALAPLGADVISARALAPLSALFETVERHGLPDTLSLFPKGETWADEVAAARKNWSFALDAQPDPGHKGAAILQARNLQRAGRDQIA